MAHVGQRIFAIQLKNPVTIEQQNIWLLAKNEPKHDEDLSKKLDLASSEWVPCEMNQVKIVIQNAPDSQFCTVKKILSVQQTADAVTTTTDSERNRIPKFVYSIHADESEKTF